MNKTISVFVTLAFIAIIAIFTVPFVSCNPSHIEIRAAMDIGSGTTNMKVAKVDKRTHQIISFLFEERVPLAFQKALSLSTDNTFEGAIREEAARVMKKLKKDAHGYKADKVVAIATSAFRTAHNGEAFAKEIFESTGVDVEVISQEQEGILGFYAALSKANVNEQNAVVWDIGGGSIQLTTKEPNGEFFIEKGDRASIAFKNALIEEVQGKSIQEVHSPNPLTKEEILAGIALARKQGEAMSSTIKEKIRNPKNHVYAIGNLFYYGIRSIVDGKDTVTREELRQAVMKLAGLTDQDVGGGPLAEVTISNAVFVLGLMEGLDIHTITFVDVNNADGALVCPGYWEEN